MNWLSCRRSIPLMKDTRWNSSNANFTPFWFISPQRKIQRTFRQRQEPAKDSKRLFSVSFDKSDVNNETISGFVCRLVISPLIHLYFRWSDTVDWNWICQLSLRWWRESQKVRVKVLSVCIYSWLYVELRFGRRHSAPSWRREPGKSEIVSAWMKM